MKATCVLGLILLISLPAPAQSTIPATQPTTRPITNPQARKTHDELDLKLSHLDAEYRLKRACSRRNFSSAEWVRNRAIRI
jgi:hypothetical protein